jgi:Icc-related predicted phosphoesterase
VPIAGHFSDLHGNLKPLRLNKVEPDFWVWTGDILREDWSRPRRDQMAIQHSWMKKHAKDFKRYFMNKPVLLVNGNHDWIDPVPYLADAGVDVRPVTLWKQEILGFTYSGFPLICFIDNTAHDCEGKPIRWMYEASDEEKRQAVDAVFKDPPDLLITHSPPYGIMDESARTPGRHFGISQLADALSMREHKIRYQFCGHIHERAGVLQHSELGMTFSNAACRLQFIEVSK